MLVILHGSRATGHANLNSDWDVAVLADHEISRDERGDLRRSFAAKLGAPEERVDIADLYGASPLLRYRAAILGKLIDGDPLAFLRFQLRAWKDYLNNEKIYDLQSRFLAKALS
jgi:predicted nucleotidyltransferase